MEQQRGAGDLREVSYVPEPKAECSCPHPARHRAGPLPGALWGKSKGTGCVPGLTLKRSLPDEVRPALPTPCAILGLGWRVWVGAWAGPGAGMAEGWRCGPGVRQGALLS